MTTTENPTNWYNISNTAIVTELGKILRQVRLQQNLTQEKLAGKTGLSRSAIYEMENGKTATSLITVVQVLRALHQLHVFDTWKATDQPPPLRMAKQNNKTRLRASQTMNQGKREENEWDWL